MTQSNFMKKLVSTRAAGYNWTKKELETRGLLKDGDLKLGYYARIKWNNKHSENAIRYGEHGLINIKPKFLQKLQDIY